MTKSRFLKPKRPFGLVITKCRRQINSQDNEAETQTTTTNLEATAAFILQQQPPSTFQQGSLRT